MSRSTRLLAYSLTGKPANILDCIITYHQVALTDTGVVVDYGEDTVAAFLHVCVGADTAEEWGQAESGPGFAARFPGTNRHEIDILQLVVELYVTELIRGNDNAMLISAAKQHCCNAVFRSERLGCRSRAVGAIPNFEVWLSRKSGNVTFRLTQVLTGHGCFGEYLCRIGCEATQKCHQEGGC
ncbi:jg17449 [Pararge aegeria aegeria]|uniref:Jg17449 protein n=1 Tax=Pararge aegeria aegeria TaxID=348720 RepID=A0A8S4S139_9NEOP|nr:jg17449 [Pararge aegeria aegeria]